MALAACPDEPAGAPAATAALAEGSCTAMTSLANRVRSTYLSFGLLVYGCAAAGAEGTSRPPGGRGLSAVAFGRASGRVDASARPFANEREPPGGAGGSGLGPSKTTPRWRALAALGAE
jgi:hypothetical protein